MFCLRTWIPVLFFLSNTSPLYLVLFVSATFYMNRPCFYCSMLLSILVISLYDWRANWFEHRHDLWDLRAPSGLATELLNSTLVELAGAAAEGLGRRVLGHEGAVVSGAQWLRELVGRREWRIPCLAVAVRL